jgi:hypothetical protein
VPISAVGRAINYQVRYHSYLQEYATTAVSLPKVLDDNALECATVSEVNAAGAIKFPEMALISNRTNQGESAKI